MSQSEARLRIELARYSSKLWERGFVANHDGNLSVRLREGRYLCTPTALSKADLSADQMLVVDGSGRVLCGTLKPFSELSLHLAYYHERPDVQAVVHAHPPCATGFGVAGVELGTPSLPEAVVSLGDFVPTVPLATPGADATAAIGFYLAVHDVLLLSGNGVLSAGDHLEMAYLRLELVEHLCAIDLVARQLGGARPLPAAMQTALSAARTRAGLGPAAHGVVAAPNGRG